MKKSLFALLSLSFVATAMACPISPAQLTKQLLKAKVQKMLSPLVVAEDNLTEEEFNGVVKRIRDFYTPIFKESGKTLNVYSDWTLPMNNAFATQDRNGSNVYFFGLFTKNKYMTKDTFLFVACHEIGHHLGGYPKSTFIPWSSAEGQADYFAASKCYREILKNDPENASAEALILPDSVKELCKTQYAHEDDYRICLRGARAAEDVGKLVDYMNTMVVKEEVLLSQPEPAAVLVTSSTHPKGLCRTHTILQASLCNRPSDIAISNVDETVGVCHEKNGDLVGNRARCWFRPKTEE